MAHVLVQNEDLHSTMKDNREIPFKRSPKHTVMITLCFCSTINWLYRYQYCFYLYDYVPNECTHCVGQCKPRIHCCTSQCNTARTMPIDVVGFLTNIINTVPSKVLYSQSLIIYMYMYLIPIGALAIGTTYIHTVMPATKLSISPHHSWTLNTAINQSKTWLGQQMFITANVLPWWDLCVDQLNNSSININTREIHCKSFVCPEDDYMTCIL